MILTSELQKYIDDQNLFISDAAQITSDINVQFENGFMQSNVYVDLLNEVLKLSKIDEFLTEPKEKLSAQNAFQEIRTIVGLA